MRGVFHGEIDFSAKMYIAVQNKFHENITATLVSATHSSAVIYMPDDSGLRISSAA